MNALVLSSERSRCVTRLIFRLACYLNSKCLYSDNPVAMLIYFLNILGARDWSTKTETVNSEHYSELDGIIVRNARLYFEN